MTSIAAVTRNIGVIATQSIAGVAPYITARTFATLDHLTSGRAGWNVVTGHHKNAAENIGLADQIDHDDRYDIADEYVDVCLQLWESWDADAIVADPERDVYAEPSRVHAIDFSGKHFKSRGPLNVHRSPQGHPALAQAGSSARGIRTAARIADVLFSIQPFRDGMKRYRDRIRAVAVDEHGRDPDTIKVFHAFQPFVAETEEIAREKLEYHNSLVSPNAGLVVLSGHLGVDLSLEDPNRTFAGMEHVPGSRGVVDQYAKAEEGRDLTLSQIGQRVGQSVSTPQVYGTATQVADWLEETSNFIGGDGFIVSPAWLPGSLEDFADLVVPELQRRGLVRSDYRAKSTLRDNLNEF
jgi:FMN-dependent oxidoreductase (nitrilotriacetate monooxygenase family)